MWPVWGRPTSYDHPSIMTPYRAFTNVSFRAISLGKSAVSVYNEKLAPTSVKDRCKFGAVGHLITHGGCEDKLQTVYQLSTEHPFHA